MKYIKKYNESNNETLYDKVDSYSYMEWIERHKKIPLESNDHKKIEDYTKTSFEGVNIGLVSGYLMRETNQTKEIIQKYEDDWYTYSISTYSNKMTIRRYKEFYICDGLDGLNQVLNN